MLWSCDYWTALEVWSVCQKNQWILGLYNSWGNIQLLFKISCPHLKSWNSCIIRGLQRRLYLWLILAEAGEVVYVIIHMVCVIPCGLKMLCGTCVSWTVLGRMLLKKKSQGSLMLDFFSFRINLTIAITVSQLKKRSLSYPYPILLSLQFPISWLWKRWSSGCRSCATPSRCREPTLWTAGKAPPSATRSRYVCCGNLGFLMLLLSSCRYEEWLCKTMKGDLIVYSAIVHMQVLKCFEMPVWLSRCKCQLHLMYVIL